MVISTVMASSTGMTAIVTEMVFATALTGFRIIQTAGKDCSGFDT